MSSKYLIQGTATFGVFLMMMQAGIQFGWNSPNLARLTSNDSAIRLTPDEASWVAASPGLGGLIGSLLGAISINFIGTKKTILLSSALTSATWTCMMLANTAVWLFVVRVLGGVACTLTLCSSALYLGEISTPGIRGTLISIAGSGLSFGTVVGTIAESYLQRMTSTPIYMAGCFVGLLIFAWLLDSPYYLIKVGDNDQAKKSISFYNPECKVDEEFKIMKELVECDTNQNLLDRLRELKAPRNIRLVILIIVLFILPSLGGVTVVSSYMQLILNNAQFSLINPRDFVIYSNIVEVSVNLLTVRLIDKFGRRILLFISSLGTAIAMISLGVHFYLLRSGFDAERIQWLPVISLLLFLIMNCIGFGRVPNTVLSEIFPQNIKSLGSFIASVSTSFIGFLALKSFPSMVDLFGEAYVFWLFAILSLTITQCVLLILPETKGKSLQEIQTNISKA